MSVSGLIARTVYDNLGAREVTAGIYSQEDEQENRETPQRRATVAEEGQGDADDRCQTQHHAHIDKHMEEEDTEYRIAIHASETVGLPFRQMNQAQDERKE